MTTVGLISDTHGKLDMAAVAAFQGVDHIIHAGDICGPEVLHELETIAPVTAVLGNNDFDEYGSGVRKFARPVIDGVRFLVAHKPTDVHIGFNGGPGIAAGDPIPQICVHGHTHVPRLVVGAEARPADFIVNPGAVFRPRSNFGRTVGFVEIDNSRIIEVRIENLRGETVMSSTKQA